MKKESLVLNCLTVIEFIVLGSILFKDNIKIIELQFIIFVLLAIVFYLNYQLKLKIKVATENVQKLKLLAECKKQIPALSLVLQQLLKTSDSANQKEVVSVLVKNLNAENLDLLMLYINQAKLYDAVEEHCQDLLIKLEPKTSFFATEKARLKKILEAVRWKSSRVHDSLFASSI